MAQNKAQLRKHGSHPVTGIETWLEPDTATKTMLQPGTGIEAWLEPTQLRKHVSERTYDNIPVTFHQFLS